MFHLKTHDSYNDIGNLCGIGNVKDITTFSTNPLANGKSSGVEENFSIADGKIVNYTVQDVRTTESSGVEI